MCDVKKCIGDDDALTATVHQGDLPEWRWKRWIQIEGWREGERRRIAISCLIAMWQRHSLMEVALLGKSIIIITVNYFFASSSSFSNHHNDLVFYFIYLSKTARESSQSVFNWILCRRRIRVITTAITTSPCTGASSSSSRSGRLIPNYKVQIVCVHSAAAH